MGGLVSSAAFNMVENGKYSGSGSASDIFNMTDNELNNAFDLTTNNLSDLSINDLADLKAQIHKKD